jgi:hypothetical protein
MKKTNRNQNMPDHSLENTQLKNTTSPVSSKDQTGKPERFINSNLDQGKATRQRYDDLTGTVENGIG